MSDVEKPSEEPWDLGFYRSELRVMQLQSESNDIFLTQVATLLSKFNQRGEQEKLRADMAEHRIRVLENGD